MLFGPMLARFEDQAPTRVGVQASFESGLAPNAIDALLHEVSDWQYLRKILFSTCIHVMGLVVSGASNSIHSAFRDLSGDVGASFKALYNRLGRIEAATSAAIVRHVAGRLAPIIRAMRRATPPLRWGCLVRILDGNQLAKTERRL